MVLYVHEVRVGLDGSHHVAEVDVIGERAVVEEAHVELVAFDDLLGAELVEGARALGMEQLGAAVVAQPGGVEQKRAEHAQELVAEHTLRCRAYPARQVERMQAGHARLEVLALGRY